MKNKLLTILALSSLSFPILASDFETQKEQCIDAVNIVKDKDYEAFKKIAPLKVRNEEQAIKRLIDKQHNKYTKSRYAGIENFLIKDVELVTEPENHRTSAIRKSATKWQASQILKVNYVFDTKIVRTSKEQSVGGFCLYALIDNDWYMTNLLK